MAPTPLVRDQPTIPLMRSPIMRATCSGMPRSPALLPGLTVAARSCCGASFSLAGDGCLAPPWPGTVAMQPLIPYLAARPELPQAYSSVLCASSPAALTYLCNNDNPLQQRQPYPRSGGCLLPPPQISSGADSDDTQATHRRHHHGVPAGIHALECGLVCGPSPDHRHPFTGHAENLWAPL
jgi:hypothetical protein